MAEGRVRVERQFFFDGPWIDVEGQDVCSLTIGHIQQGMARVVTEHPDGTESRVSMVEAIRRAVEDQREIAQNAQYPSDRREASETAAALSLLLPHEEER